MSTLFPSFILTDGFMNYLSDSRLKDSWKYSNFFGVFVENSLEQGSNFLEATSQSETVLPIMLCYCNFLRDSNINEIAQVICLFSGERAIVDIKDIWVLNEAHTEENRVYWDSILLNPIAFYMERFLSSCPYNPNLEIFNLSKLNKKKKQRFFRIRTK